MSHLERSQNQGKHNQTHLSMSLLTFSSCPEEKLWNVITWRVKGGVCCLGTIYLSVFSAAISLWLPFSGVSQLLYNSKTCSPLWRDTESNQGKEHRFFCGKKNKATPEDWTGRYPKLIGGLAVRNLVSRLYIHQTKAFCFGSATGILRHSTC